MFVTRKLAQLFVSLIVILTMVLSAFPPASVLAQGGDGAKRQVNAQTGKVSFIGPENGKVLPAAQALGLSRRPENPGLALMRRYGPEFGLQNAERDLSEIRSKRNEDGRVTVRYQQNYQGIPVMGGELIVNTNDNGDLYAINGEVSTDLSLQTQPQIDSAQAATTALQALAKWYQKTPEDFQTTEPELWIFDESLLGSGNRPAELVWRMDVTPKGFGMPVRELVLVNAERGSISLHFNQVDTIWNMTGTVTEMGSNTLPAYSEPTVLGSPLVNTYTANNTSSLPGNFVCDQSQPTCPAGDNHAKKAHLYALGTYNLYATKHLRDSLDNAGMAIVSTVKYCDPNFACPYANAFWNGAQIAYGSAYGFPLADDLVAHELTHGVTQYESNLFYWYQSGAINESFSDLWGEYYDQTNGLGNDSPSVKWLIGEDVSGLGAIRSMKNPPLYGDPDKMTSPYYFTDVAYNYDYLWVPDNGGVHYNSGVNNKAVYLMVDGGTFNGKTVSALGWDKVGAIYYEVQTNLLVSGSDYSDLYFAIQQACTNLTGQHGIVEADCLEVKDAVDAVEMKKQPLAGFNPDVAYCPAGSETDPSFSLFADDFESGEANWNRSNYFYYSTDYASSGEHEMYGNDNYNNALSTLTLAVNVPVPSGKTYLRFEHAFGFEYFIDASGGYFFDGGVLEYRVNGGQWKDAGPLFSGGQNYGGSIYYYPFGNPLGGRPGFVGDSHGYVSSRYNISSLAGKTVQFRWRLGTDNFFGSLGWVIDDVEVYQCIPIPPKPTLQSPANNALLTDYTAPLLNWSDTSNGLDHYQVQVATDNTFAAPLYDANTGTVSEFQLPADLTPNTKYFWRVQSFNQLDSTRGWSPVFSFRAAMLPPTLTSPDDLASLTSRRPLIDWDDVAGADSYKLQISPQPNLGNPITNVTVALSDYLPTTDLPANSVLYWRVRGQGANGPSLWTEIRSFTTGNPPSVPTLLKPANNALLKKDYTPLFDWSNSSVPAGTTFLRYELQVDDNNDFSSPELQESPTDSNFTPASDLTPNTQFFWRVRAVNDVSGLEHASAWSTVFTFRAAMLPPTLLLPVDASTETTRKPTFDWTDVTGATGYTLQIAVGPNFSTQLWLSVNVNVSTFTPLTNLPRNTLIHWRVRAKGPNGPSDWSNVFTFTTPP